MTGHRRPPKHIWLLVLIAVVLIGHLVALRYLLSHVAVSAAVVSGVVVVIIGKHLGAAAAFGPLYARFRRRR